MDENADTKTTVVTVRFPAQVYEAVKLSAEKNRRSISKQIIFMCEEYIRNEA